MSEVYHAVQMSLLPSSETEQILPSIHPRKRVPQSKDNPPTKVRYCPKCGKQMTTQWEIATNSKGGGSWKYRCGPCRRKRKVELNPNFYREKARKRRERNPNYKREEYARAKERNPNYSKEAHARAKARNPSHNKGYSALLRNKRQFGLTKTQYLDMIEQQGNVCAICHMPDKYITPSGEPRHLALDHDHATGRVRALLCNKCNVALGWAEDNPERLRAMADYIEYHRRKAEM